MPASAPADRIPPAHGAYSALALDLDGTLLDRAGRLAPRIAEELVAIRDRGVAVYLVSGRMHRSIMPFWRALGLRTPIVSYNGARIGLPGEPPLRERSLPEDLARQVVAFCRGRGEHVNLYFRDRLYVYEKTPEAVEYASVYDVPLERLAADAPWPARPTKLLVIVDPERRAAVRDALADEFGDRADMTTSSRCYVEILPRGVGKGAAVAWIADEAGPPLAQWVAVGDGMNDLCMIRAAGLGVAVADGEDALKSSADLVVPPLDGGGLGMVLDAAFPALRA